MMKEEIKEQKEKVKQMSRKERFRYFWYYNWIKLALGGLALLFVAYLGYTIYNNQNNESIYVAMINSVMTGDDQQALMDGFVESRQIDTENAPARINANMQLLEDQYTNLSLANSQSLQAYIETGDYDVLVADEWIIRDFASQALLRDLSEALPTEIYEQVKDRLVYYDYDDGTHIPVGIYADDIPKVKNYYPDSVKPIISLAAKSPTPEIGVEFVAYLLEE